MPLPFLSRSSLRRSAAVHSSRPESQFPAPSRMRLAACLALAAASASCGVVGSGSAPPAPTVTVQPNNAQLFIGGKMHFTANVQNASNATVSWAVQPASGGTIDASGNYVAPATLPSPVDVSVIASLESDATVSGSATIMLQGSLAVSPVRAGVTTTQELPLAVVTRGVSPADVTWSVDGIPNGNSSVGTITTTSSGAIYNPPATAGTYTLAASLNANPSVTGQATAYVTGFPGTFTWRNDNARSGINNQELALSPSTVNSSTFGKLFSCPVDGYVYAQPLYLANLQIPGSGTHNVVFVATENDSVYAFDADASSCTKLWAQPARLTAGGQPIAAANLQPTLPPMAPPLPLPPIGPFIGITSTPAIDAKSPSPSSLYVMSAAMIQPAQNSPPNTPPTYQNSLYQLDAATGSFRTSGVRLESSIAGFGSVSQLGRSALLLDNGAVYVAFGSDTFGSNSLSSNEPDAAPANYHGWLFEFDSTSLIPKGDFNVTSNSVGGGIWQSGGGPSADESHNVFVATGDGPPNQTNFGNYSDSVLRMSTAGGLGVHDYFTPCDQGIGWGADPSAFLESQSSAPLLVDTPGPSSQMHLVLSGSKEGALYVIDRDAMGKFSPNCAAPPPGLQTISVGGPVLSTPLYWNNSIYVAPGQSTASPINPLKALPMSLGIVSPNPVSQSKETLGPQGATPVLSANGTSGAVLWLIDTTGAFAPNNAGPAILRAYDPNDLSNELYDSTQAPKNRDQAGPAVKFTVPTVANGKVYVGTQTELDVYGLLP